MSRYKKYFVEGRRVLLLSAFDDGMRVFAMKITGIPIGIAFRPAGNGWGILDFIAWDELSFDLRADEGLDQADGIGGVPVGGAGVGTDELADLIEGLPVSDDDVV